MTIVIKPNRPGHCWTATFPEGGAYPAGTYPLPFHADAPAHLVRAELQAKFPKASVRHVQVVCEGCAS
jgi:hypothetical protein